MAAAKCNRSLKSCSLVHCPVGGHESKQNRRTKQKNKKTEGQAYSLTTGREGRRIRAFSIPWSCRSPRDDDAQAATGGRRGAAVLPLHFPLRQTGFSLRRGRDAPQGLDRSPARTPRQALRKEKVPATKSGEPRQSRCENSKIGWLAPFSLISSNSGHSKPSEANLRQFASWLNERQVFSPFAFARFFRGGALVNEDIPAFLGLSALTGRLGKPNRVSPALDQLGQLVATAVTRYNKSGTQVKALNFMRNLTNRPNRRRRWRISRMTFRAISRLPSATRRRSSGGLSR